MLTDRRRHRNGPIGPARDSIASDRSRRSPLLGGASPLAVAAALLACAPRPAHAVDTTVSTAQGAKTVTGNDTLTVTGAGSVSAATAVTWQLGTGGTPGIIVSNAGTITGTTRAFDTTGTATGARSFSLTNAVGGTITSANDAFRINSAITSGALSVDNTGLLTSTTNGRALDFRSFTGGTTTIVNRAGANANGGGVIRAVGNDGIGLGGGAITITNSNVIEAGTGGGNFRAINLSSGAALSSLTLTNNAGARISSTDDAVRIGSAAPSGATILVNNAGTLLSQTGQAIDFDSAGATGVSITINNLVGGTIQANSQSALRPGQNATVNNAGTIASFGTAGASNDGVDYNGNSAGTFNNLAGGTVSGLRHGVNMSATTGFLTVTNAAGGSITGRNGSGVGLDGAGSVTNAGTITGAYAGTGNGDGDGIDIDFAATIVNSGTVQGTGAGGFDARGRANNSEGVSIGGGSVTNSGTISGQGQAIVVNNDSNADNSRSGVAATTITNLAGGTIVGLNGYAIRLENKTGTAADNDTIVNSGTIIGNGAIPDPNGVVLLQSGAVDGGSVGTLDGVRYTGTGSARFIRGDGSAIQTGEGDDVLTNFGTIIGNTGRAINMEGGNDTLNLFTGSRIVGRIDGGAGNDTINLLGTGTGTLANVVNFETLNVSGGTWSLLDDQAYASGATIAAGATLQIGTGGTAGSINADIVDNGSLVFNRSDAVAFGRTISGTGTVTQAGSGVLTLSGANTYSGGTILAAGTIAVSADANLGAASGSLTFTGGTLETTASFLSARRITVTATGGAVQTDPGVTTTFSGPISGPGGLTKTGAGTLVLSGTGTYTGPTTVSAGTLAITAGGSITSDVTNNATFTTAGILSGSVVNNATATAQGQINGAVTNNATGSFTLTGALTGITALTNDGTFTLAGNSLSVGALTSAGNGGVIQNTSAAPATLTVGTAGGSGTYAAILQDGTGGGALTLAKSGIGTLTLSGVNSYSGGTVLIGGTVQVASDANLGGAAGALSFNGGALATTASFSTSRNATLNAGGGTFAPAAGTVLTETGVIAGTGPLVAAGAGILALTGTNTYTGATTISTGAALQLGNGGATGSIGGTPSVINNGTLVFNRSDIVTFAAPVSGTGNLVQAGSGTTVLTAANTYAGRTVVDGGTLEVNGSIVSPDVTVNRGGTLSGLGKIGDPVINAGGTLAPGSAARIGTLTIAGPLVFQPGSGLQVRVTPAANDRVDVIGAAQINGGSVSVLANAAAYAPGARYTLLTATGGVTGRFDALVAPAGNLFLTPRLGYDANDVYFDIAKTAFAAFAFTRNGAAVGNALDGLGVGNPMYQAVLNQTTGAGTRQALNALSGEAQASAVSAISQTAFQVQETILDHLRFGEGNGSAAVGGPGLTGSIGQRFAPGTTLPAAYSADRPGGPVIGLVPVRPTTPNYAVWGQGFGSFGSTSANGNAARLTRQTGGFVLGAETGFGAVSLPGVTDLRVGVAAGYSFTSLAVTSRQSTGQVESGFGAVYARGSLGPVQVRLGAAYAGNALDTRRTVVFPGFSQSVTGKAGGDTVQGFGEIGYRAGFASGYIEPFAGAAALHIRRDGFSEVGGASALTVYGRAYDIETATLGLQGQALLSEVFGTAVPVVARGLIGYRRAFGDVVPQALLAFGGGGQAFLTAGVPIARDAIVASAGLDWQVALNTNVGVAYTGQVGDRAEDHAVKGSFNYRW